MQCILSAVVRTLVLYSLAEVQLGHAQCIHVRVNGQSFSVEDDGRGHSIAKTIEGAPYLQFIYSHLDYPFGEAESTPIQLQGLGMSLLNSLCTRLSVLVQKSAVSLELAFQEGKLVHHDYREVASATTGNKISGEVSGLSCIAQVELQALQDWLSKLAAVTPSLAVHFNGRLLRASP